MNILDYNTHFHDLLVIKKENTREKKNVRKNKMKQWKMNLGEVTETNAFFSDVP